ncbi:MAG: mannose/fructose/N-acetylgalactosamine-specific phosphotransferase system component IID [Maribacter sp.]|jgi:mannose/fructose/N-acetylgalactosamine-specific phosphotransferase system component IID
METHGTIFRTNMPVAEPTAGAKMALQGSRTGIVIYVLAFDFGTVRTLS